MTSSWKENCKQPCLSRRHGGSKRLSRIALVEDGYELSVCPLYPMVDQHKSYQGAGVALQTLDASLLLGKRRNQTPKSSSQVPCSSSCSSVTDLHSTLVSERLSGGFDNTAFDLEAIQPSFSKCRRSLTDENEGLGSNTDSNMESKTNENRFEGKHQDVNNFLPYPNEVQVQEKNDGYKSDSGYGSRPKIKRNVGVVTRKLQAEGNKGALERVEAPQPCGKLRRGRPCQLPLRTFSEINATPTPSRTACVPWTAEAQAIRKQLTDMVVNNAFVTDSESSEDSSIEENIDHEELVGCGETMSSPQKTDCAAKKTDSRSQWRNYGEPVSTQVEMVQVGCVSRPLSGHYTNSISVSNREPYLRTVNTVAVSASVSTRGINLVNPVRTVGKISNDVRGSCSITTTPTVSALTKVSSVRIVPTPTATPTPSVTGASENGSAKLALPLQRVPLRQHVQDFTNSVANVSPVTSKQLESVTASGSVQHSQPSVSLGSPARVSAPLDLKVPESHASRESSSNAFVPVPAIPSRSTSAQSPSSRDVLHNGAQIVHQSQAIPVSAATSQSGEQSRNAEPLQTELTSPNSDTQTSPEHVSASLPPPGTSRPTTSQVAAEGDGAQRDVDARRVDRERRRERRERRRERRAQRMSGTLLLPPPPPLGVQTEVAGEAIAANSVQPNARLPDLLNSHVPPPYSTLPNGPRSHGGLLPPPHPPGSIPSAALPPGGPPGLPLHLHPPPPGAPIPPGYPPPPTPGSPIRPPPDCPWPFFGSRRSRGTPRPCGGEEDGKSCCGMLVTQAVSIRWFIIMIAFVGLCCTVVGTVLGAIKTHNSEYVTITLLMIGVGIVLITVSGVAWHLTSRDAPCRVMLGLAPAGVQGPMHGGESRRFMRMAPSFGRPHHPYAAMMYPEFQFRPPPPSYQASMQEYRLRLLLLDRANASHHAPYPHPPLGVASPPPTYRSAQHRTTTNTLGRESIYSHPPSYRSREGSISQNPDAGSTNTNPNPTVPPVHSRDPSCLSFLSHDSLYSTNSHDSRNRNRNADGSITGNSALVANKDFVEVRSEEVLSPGDASKKDEEVLIASTSNNVCIENTNLNNQTNNIINNNTLSNNNTLNRLSHNSQTNNNNNRNAGRRDGNTVTIVQTTGSSQVIGNQSVIVTVSGDEAETSNGRQQRSGVRVSPRHQQAFSRPPPPQQQLQSGNSRADAEISVLAHL